MIIKNLHKKEYGIRGFIIALILLFSSIITGTIGFMVIEKYTFLEALFMSLITLSTVGYTEVRPLSENGMLFTSIYIFFNIGIFAYTISIVSAYIFEGRLQNIYKNILKQMDIKKLNEHIIICGFGRNGSKACEELGKAGIPYVVIESDKAMVERRMHEFKNVLHLDGDATLDETLIEAGIKNAKSIVITLPKDADNVFITLTARQLNPKIQIIARASEESSELKLKRAGADYVVMPDTIGGMHMANLITKPNVIRFLDILSGFGENRLMLEEIKFEDLKTELKGCRISDLNMNRHSEITNIGFKNEHGQFTVNPAPDTIIDKGDTLIVLGKVEHLNKFKEYCLD